MFDSAPDFDALLAAFSEVKPAVGIAEAHGLLCGMLCGSPQLPLQDWVAQVVEEPAKALNAERYPGFVAAVTRLYDATAQEFKQGGVGLYPLIPGDDAMLGERVAALSKWCTGLLAGLGLVQAIRPDRVNEEVREVLTDLVQISRLSDQVPDTDDDENDFEEILEYARVGALLVFEHLAGPPALAASAVKPGGRMH